MCNVLNDLNHISLISLTCLQIIFVSKFNFSLLGCLETYEPMNPKHGGFNHLESMYCKNELCTAKCTDMYWDFENPVEPANKS